MIIPVKCFSCGRVLADKYRLYCELVRSSKLARSSDLKEDSDIDRQIYLTSENIEKTPEAEVLDMLGLDSKCCRIVMLTHVDI